MTRIVLNGAAGRMGRAVEQAAADTTGVEIRARVDRRENCPAGGGVWTDDLASVLERGDVVVDFSAPESARAAAALCAARGAALVTGTTGLSGADEQALGEAAKAVAVLRATNFSLGVAALRAALKAALLAAPRTWDVEIVERHHRRKKDSPSGTALTLADDALAARGLAREALQFGRQGAVGERPADEIGVHALRGGTWVGDHTVLLAGEGEWIELRHVAQDRAAFAHGAIAAARFVASAPPGSYTLADLLAGAASRRP